MPNPIRSGVQNLAEGADNAAMIRNLVAGPPGGGMDMRKLINSPEFQMLSDAEKLLVRNGDITPLLRAPIRATDPPTGLDAIQAPPPAAADMGLGGDLWTEMSRASGRNQALLSGKQNNLRNQPFAPIARDALQMQQAYPAVRAQQAAQRGQTAQDLAMMGGGVAAAGALGAGAYMVGQQAMKPGVQAVPPPQAPPAGLTSTGGTADLVAESRPAPVVDSSGVDESNFADTFKSQYNAREQKREAAGQGGYDPRQQAEMLIGELNSRRQKAGREIPEAPQINALLAQSNEMRNSRSPQAAGRVAGANPQDPHAQAQFLIAQLNEMRSKAGREVPQAQQIMAEVRRLQAQGDEMRNARTRR